ncbi:MAG: thermonuclease family protein [Candidatus Omnitrophota bacterium]|nr:thermonuclease family protein [Candidatus Omnitrophota bacterium]
MRKIKIKKLPVWAVVVLLCAAALARAVELQSDQTITAAVVQRAIDGDTVVLVGGERVRYIGVDTPELHHPKKKVQPYAREAMEFNRRLVEGQKVRLETDVERRDRYGRLLAYVYLEDGRFVNAELLKAGYAQLLTIPPNVRYVDLFIGLQKQARDAKRGLWGKR